MSEVVCLDWTLKGARLGRAKSTFTQERAKRVAGQTWHPLQESIFDDDGSPVLSFLRANDREIMGDIMRFRADAQVLLLAALRTKVQKCFLEASASYV